MKATRRGLNRAAADRFSLWPGGGELIVMDRLAIAAAVADGPPLPPRPAA